MVLFRKKPTEERSEDIKDIKKLAEEMEETFKEELPMVEKPKKQFAPLFVKIERYRTVLSLLNEIKANIYMVKHALAVQKQIESLSEENKAVIESALDKIDQKIGKLDIEFTRPKGYEEEELPFPQETEHLETSLKDLKDQIDSIKSELKNIA